MRERTGYEDDEVERIIERAAEIDADQRRELDAFAVREIADRAGISPLAIDRALLEHESKTGSRMSRVKRARIVILAVALVAGVVLYALMRTVTQISF